MANLAQFELAAGDYNPQIDITLKDANTGDPATPRTWDAIDLSAVNRTVKLIIHARGSSTVLATIDCTKVSGGSTGQVYAPELSYQFATAGVYEGEIKIYVDGVASFTVNDKIKFLVRD